MENNFIWTDDKVMEFASKWLNDRVKWAIMHDYAAAPMPIQMELENFKKEKKYIVNWVVTTIHSNGGIQTLSPEIHWCEILPSSIYAVKRLKDNIILKRGDHTDNGIIAFFDFKPNGVLVAAFCNSEAQLDINQLVKLQ